jgi:hypothetical protein
MANELFDSMNTSKYQQPPATKHSKPKSSFEPSKLTPLQTDPREPKTVATKSLATDPEAQTGSA